MNPQAVQTWGERKNGGTGFAALRHVCLKNGGTGSASLRHVPPDPPATHPRAAWGFVASVAPGRLI